MKTKKSCWWNEGGRCYIEPCKRDENSRSHKICDKICDKHLSKRKMLETCIPGDKLVILSEKKND